MLSDHRRRLRRQHIGASESPAICGVSPWMTAADVYWRKVGDVADTDTEPMATGRRLETVLIDYAVERLGLQGVRRNQFRVSPDEPILAATCDALADGVVIEAKTSAYADGWGDDMTDQVPDHVLIQVEHQLFVTGAQVAYVPLLLARRQFEWRLYRVPRYEELIEAIVERCVRFWREHVEPRVPPSSDPPPIEYLRSIRRQPVQVDLPAVVDDLVAQYISVREQLRALEAERDRLQRELIGQLGEAECGVTPSGWRVAYTAVESRTIDTKLLRTRYPEIAREVERVNTYRRFDLKEVKHE